MTLNDVLDSGRVQPEKSRTSQIRAVARDRGKVGSTRGVTAVYKWCVQRLAFVVFFLGCGTPAPAVDPTHASPPVAHAHDPSHQHGHQHDFSDASRWATQFDAADRASWQKPEEVIALLHLAPRSRVADIGAGTGYFLPYLSRAV